MRRVMMRMWDRPSMHARLAISADELNERAFVDEREMTTTASPTVRVEKATSDLLIGPDWTLNLEICDSINSDHWQAKDVVKAVKKRLQHKSPRVQFMALILLETMIKNCGDYVHFQVADRNILQEMVKIVKKKTDMQVRDKILVLLDSWQEAFGGPGGKYPQYYWAYEDLRRSGVEFPRRSPDAAPIFTPPVAHPMIRHAPPGYGMPSDSSIRLDEAMASEMGNLSLSDLDSMGGIVELLSDMLKAVDPNDREGVKDEVIVDLATQCRSNQKKLMRLLSTTGDENLLEQGLSLNDNIQSLLARHDAIASGHPLPTEAAISTPPPQTDKSESSPKINTSTSSTPVVNGHHVIENEEEEDDDFAQLARRNTKFRPVASQSTSTSVGDNWSDSIAPSTPSSTTEASNSSFSNALSLPDPPTPVRTATTKDQDMPSRPLQQYHSFGSRGNSGVTASAVGDAQRNASPRLFEDLVDLKNKDGGFKGSGSSTSLSGASTNPESIKNKKVGCVKLLKFKLSMRRWFSGFVD
ncbi:hypothetical protein QJS04_geneDACA017073 [Acorus gramineus]|uniref:Uncharacterized protein n=1 Tax=Acorus gramineus TaxID=55184 RepID=A0AAV9AMK6_ACOGR|nr:hypothetical protein QJS04_geneDACA017073 [Acorus gramineus]